MLSIKKFIIIFLLCLYSTSAHADKELTSGEGIDDASVPGVSVTLSLEQATSSNLGGVTLDATDFSVTAGDVTLGSSPTISTTLTVGGSVIRSPGTKTICSSTNTDIASKSCDGVSDGGADDVQFQALFDGILASNANFGNILTTAGTFTFDAPVIIKGSSSPYTRVGITCVEGAGTTITASNSFVGNNLFEFTETANDPTAAFFMDNCFLAGNKSNVTIGAFDTKVGGVNNVPLWDLQLHKVIMFDFGANVLTIDNPWGFVFENSQIEDSDECGIVISQGGTGIGNAKTGGGQIIGSKIIQVGQDASPACLAAIKLDGVIGIRIIGNELSTQATSGYGVMLVNAERNMILGNDFASGDNRKNGISIDINSDMNVVDSNHFEGLTQGIVSLSLSQNVITSNLFTNISSTELNLASGSKIVKMNNQGDDIPTNSDTPIRVIGGTQFVSASEAPLAGMNLTDSQFRFTDAAGAETSSHHIDGTLRSVGRLQLASFTDASASCAAVDSDRLFGDKDCDAVKDAGEEFLDSTGGGAFSDASDPVVLNTTTKDVVIGAIQLNSAKLTVKADADQTILSLQATLGQTANLIDAEDSLGNDLFVVTNAGTIESTSSGLSSITFANSMSLTGSASDAITLNGTFKFVDLIDVSRDQNLFITTKGTMQAVAADIGARVFHTQDNTMTNNVYTVLDFNSERWDTDSIHNPSSNSTRLTATTAGKYFINCTVTFDADTTGQRIIAIQESVDSEFIAQNSSGASDGSRRLSVSTVFDLAATQYVECFGFQNSGGNLDIAPAAKSSAEFSMQKF